MNPTTLSGGNSVGRSSTRNRANPTTHMADQGLGAVRPNSSDRKDLTYALRYRFVGQRTTFEAAARVRR